MPQILTYSIVDQFAQEAVRGSSEGSTLLCWWSIYSRASAVLTARSHRRGPGC